MEEIKDLIQHQYNNDKVRIIGFITKVPTPESFITVNGTKYYQFFVDTDYEKPKYSNNVPVWIDKKGKEKFFDSGKYKKNSLVVVHGALRSHLTTELSENGNDLTSSTLFVNLEQMHYYPFCRQTFKNSTSGMVFGQVKGYKFRKTNGHYCLDAIVKVDHDRGYSLLKISTLKRSMHQLMETDEGDLVGFKFNLQAHTNQQKEQILFANAFYVSNKPEKFLEESFQSLDSGPSASAPIVSNEEFLQKWQKKQDKMYEFLHKYFPEQYDELQSLAYLGEPTLKPEQPAPIAPQPKISAEEYDPIIDEPATDLYDDETIKK